MKSLGFPTFKSLNSIRAGSKPGATGGKVSARSVRFANLRSDVSSVFTFCADRGRTLESSRMMKS